MLNSNNSIWLKTRVKLKQIKSLMVNGGSICINSKLKTKMKKTLKFRVDIGVRRG
jgi:hypothetical protein